MDMLSWMHGKEWVTDKSYLKLGIAPNPYAAEGKFGKYKMMRNTWKIIETLAHGYSSERAQRELSNEYQHGRVLMVFKNLRILVLRTKVALALEGLKYLTGVRVEVNLSPLVMLISGTV